MNKFNAAKLLTTAAAGGLCVMLAAGRGRGNPFTRLVASEALGPVLVDASRGIDHVNIGTVETRSDGTVVWPKLYFGISAPMDWSQYDFLELTLYNSSPQAVSFSFEIKDSRSTDYWTRVNSPQLLGPGLQTIKLPTRLRVGETGRPGRALDSSKVVSLILARDDENDRTPVEVRRIELKKSAKTSAAGVLAFHVGPEDAGVPDGFAALTEKTLYDPARKWGWLEHRFWAPYPQVNRVIAPDRLTASNLTIASAKLRVDLKPGAYRVWMIIDHPGGFWGEYPYYHRRTVRAQGKLALDERMDPEKAKADYFRWQDAEDREGDDLFERYWSQIIEEKAFDTRVENGRLDLDFENEGCPDRLPCFGMALSALVIFPVNTREERARGQRWLAELRAARRAEFQSQHQIKAKSLTGLLGSMPSGLQVWDVSSDLDLSHARSADVEPLSDSSKTRPRISIFRNSRGFFAPAVSWKGVGPEVVGWRIEGIPDDIAIEGGWIKYRALRDSNSGANLYSVRERWVTEDKRRAFSREDLGRLWLRFIAPKSARPGLYPATLVVTTRASGQAKIAFELRVFKAQAADLDFPVGPFRNNIAEDWWDDSALHPRLEHLETKSMTKMRALGLTAFSFNPRMRVSAIGNGISLDTREVDRVMTAAKQMGFKGLVGYGDVFLGEDLCARPDGDSVLSGVERFKQVTDELESRARERHWLPLALIACDEPVGAAVKELMERLKSLPKTDGGRLVQWSVTTSLGPRASSETRELTRLVGIPFLEGFSPDEIHSPWAYYNDISRKTLGLGMFRLRQTTDMRYRLLWAWNQNLSNPYFDFDSREGDVAWCSSTRDARLRCSVELDRVIDRGITDYRVALGLKQVLDGRKDLNDGQMAQGLDILKAAQSDDVNSDEWLLKAGEYLEHLR